MESLLFLLKGILIGLLFGVPVGAVGAMTVSRTLNHGFGAGMVTGLGSSAADCIYAGVGAFGLTLVSDFLLKYETVIHLLGGCLVIAMGTLKSQSLSTLAIFQYCRSRYLDEV